ncbi:MAG: anthranilate phosphoribosyltransferase [Methanoregulaceae archaeon]
MIASQILDHLALGRDLPRDAASRLMQDLLTGAVTPTQAGALLIALRMKGERPEEIAAFANVMRSCGLSIRPRVSGTLVDTCGTGGDGSGTFNISTAAAFVAAGAGVPIVKHGNRGVSSRCGSADVFEALGITIDLPPDRMNGIIEETGIGFLFAPRYHPGVANVMGVRKELGVRTVFNLLGPFANPAGAEAQLMGVYSPALTEPLAHVHQLLGTSHALVVHGSGLDEITTTGETHVAELVQGSISTYEIHPDNFGIPIGNLSDLSGGTAKENAHILEQVLSGEEGPHRDIVILNAGAAIYLGGKSGTIASGITRAEQVIDSGSAYAALVRLRAASGERT